MEVIDFLDIVSMDSSTLQNKLYVLSVQLFNTALIA